MTFSFNAHRKPRYRETWWASLKIRVVYKCNFCRVLSRISSLFHCSKWRSLTLERLVKSLIFQGIKSSVILCSPCQIRKMLNASFLKKISFMYLICHQNRKIKLQDELEKNR